MLWIFTLMLALAEMTSAIQTPPGYAKAISAWFHRRRGLALGIAMSGVGLGAFVMPQFAERLIERVGWRGAYVSLGLRTFAIAFPVVALWIREPRPGEGERGEPASIAVLAGHTVREATGTGRLWMLGAAFFLRHRHQRCRRPHRAFVDRPRSFRADSGSDLGRLRLGDDERPAARRVSGRPDLRALRRHRILPRADRRLHVSCHRHGNAAGDRCRGDGDGGSAPRST